MEFEEIRINLRNEFEKETGFTWENEQGEPDLDYVLFLENKVADRDRWREIADRAVHMLILYANNIGGHRTDDYQKLLEEYRDAE